MKSVFMKNSMEPLFHHHDESCGCGHSHHDHHEEGVHCDCGHEHHSREHHGHHDEDSCDCGCGHEHHDHDHHHGDEDDSGGDDEEHSHHHDSCNCGHEHHHDESCGCGHEHHHDESCGCGHEHHEHGRPEHHDDRSSQETGAPLSGMEKKVYILENLGCAHCASKMEEQISRLNGVQSASITFATKQLRITAANPQQHLTDIRKICADIESQVKVIDPAAEAEAAAAKPKKKKISKDNLELLGIIAGALLFAAGVAVNSLNLGENLLIVLTAASYVILGGKVILEALRNISKGQVFDENFLMSIATIGAFVIAEYLEAVGVMLFYRIGEYFEHRAVERSRSQIMDAVDMRPEVVNLITESAGESAAESVRVIPAEDAAAGDILLIRPGDRVPLDGIIVEGESRLDTSPITGEPVPVGVSAGDRITSGCVNTSGRLKLRVEKPLEESMVSRILESVENAAASKPKLDRFITRFSRVYTPCVVLAALILAIVPSLVTGDWNYWVYTALTFLVMSCPCALVLSVPLAFFSGIGAGSRRGILFKGGVSMEALGKLKAVVMDKTGTITEGNFQLQKVVSAGDYTESELLALSAGCEQNSTHPIAVSIVNAAKEESLAVETPSALEEIAGHGISAQMSSGQVLCGNRKLMDRFRIAMPQLSEEVYGAEVYIAINGTFAGYLVISDTLKADAAAAVARLKAMGLHTVMLTGDAKDSAEAVAAKAGIDEVHAKLLPQDKLAMLSKVREEKGSVMFVGDGINDAPVLAGADVGAAMGSGADAAIEAADAVFMNTSVEAIPDAVSIARITGKIAMQNVVFALIVKAIVMILGVIGFANMWLAVFADSGVAMLCVLNSIRILYRKK